MYLSIIKLVNPNTAAQVAVKLSILVTVKQQTKLNVILELYDACKFTTSCLGYGILHSIEYGHWKHMLEKQPFTLCSLMNSLIYTYYTQYFYLKGLNDFIIRHTSHYNRLQLAKLHHQKLPSE